MDVFLLLAAFFQSEGTGDPVNAGVSVDIASVVLRAQNGDRDSVALLYQMYSTSIYRYIAFRTPTAEDAEDLTAEVFIRMVEGLAAYRLTQAPFEAWLYRIAAARVADFYRQRRRQPNAELNDSMLDSEPLPEDQIEQRQLFATVREALQQLSEEHQTILILRFVERKSHEEVAALLGKSMTAVKSAQHRALNQLTALLGSDQKIRHYLRGQHG